MVVCERAIDLDVRSHPSDMHDPSLRSIATPIRRCDIASQPWRAFGIFRASKPTMRSKWRAHFPLRSYPWNGGSVSKAARRVTPAHRAITWMLRLWPLWLLACQSDHHRINQTPPIIEANAVRHPTVIRPAPGDGYAEIPAHSTENQDRSNTQPQKVRCLTCHTGNKDTPSLAKRLDAQGLGVSQVHTTIRMEHGKLACLSCHDQDDRGSLHLADGTTLPISSSMQLCAQCHGPQMRDYEHGSHGGMNGYWDLRRGPRQRNHCLHCHGAHNPRYPIVRPMPPPRDRFLSPTH